MKNLYLIGCGGFASEVLFLIERNYLKQNRWSSIAFIDDDSKKHQQKIRNCEVLGDLDYLLKIEDNNFDVIVTINNTEIRKKIIEKLSNSSKKIYYPNLIDNTAIVDTDFLNIGKGNIIMHYVILSTNLNIGDFNIFNSYSGVGHDCFIGDFNTFNPRVSISGNVVIENANDFGVNSCVLQNKTIGSNNDIWTNSTIVKNIKNAGKYFGIPAKKLTL